MLLAERKNLSAKELVDGLMYYIQEDFFYSLLVIDEVTFELDFFENSYSILIQRSKVCPQENHPRENHPQKNEECLYLFTSTGIFP